jgi:hypothetical protein
MPEKPDIDELRELDRRITRYLRGRPPAELRDFARAKYLRLASEYDALRRDTERAN